MGVGGVVIAEGRALLIRRGGPPLEGEWSIPGGMLELGETIEEGVRRELAEETGIEVRVLDLIEVFERVFPGEDGRTQYHFVILDYLCEVVSGEARAASDVTDVAWAREEELVKYALTTTATRVIRGHLRCARTALAATEVSGTASAGGGFGEAAEAAFAAAKIFYGVGEIGGVEFGPHARREKQFGVGAFPEHEIAEAAVAAGADQQVHVERGAAGVGDFAEALGEFALGNFEAGEHPAGGAKDGVARGIIDGDAQFEGAAGGGEPFSGVDGLRRERAGCGRGGR